MPPMAGVASASADWTAFLPRLARREKDCAQEREKKLHAERSVSDRARKRERFIRIYSDGIKARTLERVETFFLLSGGGSISLRTEEDDAAATGAAAVDSPRGVSNERSSSEGGCKFVGSIGAWCVEEPRARRQRGQGRSVGPCHAGPNDFAPLFVAREFKSKQRSRF